MSDFRLDRIGSAERGTNPMVIARLDSGFAVIGDTQFLPGYCLLLAAPAATHLSDLPPARRKTFLYEMPLIGEAIERACHEDGLVRMNYEILGNTDSYLHAHIFPRYAWEPEDRLKMPVFHYPPDRWSDAKYQFSPELHGHVRSRIAKFLQDLNNPVAD